MTYFITGSSGVGKSTVAKELAKILPGTFAVHDFDELGVPLDADAAWRIERTKEWIHIAKDDGLNGISTVIVGLTYPSEVSAIAEQEHLRVACIMLEVEQQELERRLMALRFSTPERIENLKKYEGVSVEEFFENNTRHVAQMRDEAVKHGAVFIDTTRLTPQQVAERILALLT